MQKEIKQDEEQLDLGPEEPEEKPEKKEDGIEELKRQLQQERQLRMDAQKQANEASERAAAASNDVQDSNLQLVNAAIDASKREMEENKIAFANALANGDHMAAADAQLEIAKVAQQLLQLETGRTALEAKPKAEPKKSDQIETFLNSLTKQSADWLRAHPETMTNPVLNRKMLLAHALAVDEGIEVDSRDYFDLIEQRLGFKSKRKEEDDDGNPMSGAEKEDSYQERSPSAAPVSRGGSKNVIRLTSEEREIAALSGMSDEEYAKNKQDLAKEKRYN